MKYPFNFQIDAADYENPIIKDLNSLFIHDTETYLPITTVAAVASGDVITLDGTVTSQFADLITSRVIKIHGTGYTNKYLNVKHFIEENVDALLNSEIHVFEDLGTDVSGLELYMNFNTANDDDNDSATGRGIHLMFMYVTAKPVAGDSKLEIDNTEPETALEWTFEAGDGGWFVLEALALKRFNLISQDENAINIQEPYITDEIVWDLDEEDEIVFYKSLVDNNEAALTDEESWEVMEEITYDDLITYYNLTGKTDDGIYYYTANAFILGKLEKLINDIILKMDCGCKDSCEIQVELKLAMYLEQIRVLVERKNYSKAQKSYEQALQLAQDSI